MHKYINNKQCKCVGITVTEVIRRKVEKRSTNKVTLRCVHKCFNYN